MIAQCTLLSILTAAFAIPEVVFPFNSQVPPVARVGQFFRFSFSATTFRPNGEVFQYSLTSAPAWLHLNSSSRMLFGTPGNVDVGSPTFTITASDSTGSGTMQATLVVVAFEAPVSEASISEALAKAGKMCGPNSVTFAPMTQITFKFPSNMFTSTSKQLSYYATLSDHTPLPGWLAFDPYSLLFLGTAPPISASPQDFEVLIIASDVLGFAGAWVSFTIVVSDHQFYFEQTQRTVDIGLSAEVDISDLRSQLILDGTTASDENLLSSIATVPSWISFDQSSFRVTGVPPLGTKTQNISVAAQDIFGDVANMTLELVIAGLILAEFGTLNATSGTEFNYTLSKSAFAKNNIHIDVDLGSASSWLHFDPTSRSISGMVPTNIPAQNITGNISVASLDGVEKDSQTFTISVKAANTPFTSTAPTTPTDSYGVPPTGGVYTATGSSGKISPSRSLGMIVGIVVAIILSAVGMIFFIIWCRSPHHGLQRTRSSIKKTISRPMASESDPCTTEIEHNHEDLEKASDEIDRMPDNPPQITLDLSPEKTTRRSSQLGFPTTLPTRVDNSSVVPNVHSRVSVASSIINDGDAFILDNINRTSWGYLDASTHKPHDSMRLATQIARASRQSDNDSPAINGRTSRHLSGNRMSSGFGCRSSSTRNTSGALPVNPRWTGLGHGRTPPEPAWSSMREMLLMQQQQHPPSNAESYSQQSKKVMPSYPPTPGSIGLSRQPSQLGCQRRSMRDSMLLDSRRVNIQRPLPRRGHRSAFFSGGLSSRGSSSGPHHSTILGLHTIHGSPDLGAESPAAESSDALTPGTSSVTKLNGGSSKFEPSKSHLDRKSTQTSSKSAETWQTTATTTTTNNAASGSDASLEVEPSVSCRNPTHSHNRWSSNLMPARISHSFNTEKASDSEQTTPAIGDTVLQASGNELGESSADEVDADGDTRMSDSVYSQNSVAVVSPVKPPTRNKIPVGGVRLPPFASSACAVETSIMERPHPRASFRNDGMGSSAVRAPLRNMKDGEHRFSGSGFSSGARGEESNEHGTFEKCSRKSNTLKRTRLRSARWRQPVSVESFENVERSLKDRFERAGSSDGRDKAFL
jgi:hypothetical protein